MRANELKSNLNTVVVLLVRPHSALRSWDAVVLEEVARVGLSAPGCSGGGHGQEQGLYLSLLKASSITLVDSTSLQCVLSVPWFATLYRCFY